MLLKEDYWPSTNKLLTALVEVEMIINSRPLSFVSADDFEEPLTPSHLPDRVYRDDLDHDVMDAALYSRRAQHLSSYAGSI